MSVWVDLQGQDSVVAQLRRAAQSSSPTHAWLLTGPPGSGRSNAALAFAAALVCERPELAAEPWCARPTTARRPPVGGS